MKAVYLAVCVALLACPARAGGRDGSALSDIPDVVRAHERVFLMENHSTAYLVWHVLGVRGATLVHLDAHDDCRYVGPAKLRRLEALAEAGAYAEIFEQSDILPSLRYEAREDALLYDLGNFIYPCAADGTVSTIYWVVPEKELTPPRIAFLRAHLAQALRVGPEAFDPRREGKGFRVRFLGAEMIVSTLDALPRLPEGSLLDIDVDFFSFEQAMTIDHLTGALSWDPEHVCSLLRQRVPAPLAVTVSSSVWGGYLPLSLRYLADGCFEFFASGSYPPYAAALLDTWQRMRETGQPAPLPAAPPSGAFEPAFDHLRGMVAIMEGRHDEAAPLLTRAARGRACYAKGLLDAAEAYLNTAQSARAHDMLHRFERFAGGPATDSTSLRVRILLAEEKPAEADKLAARLVAWRRSPQSLLLRAGVLTQLGRHDEAIALYSEAARDISHRGIAEYNVGVVLETAGRDAEAIEHYREAVRWKPRFANAHDNLGFLLLRRGELASAVEHLRRAIEINPDNMTALNNLGSALLKQGQASEAIPHLRRAVGLRPDLAAVHAGLAAALAASGNAGEAAVHYRTALRLRPGWADVEAALAELAGSGRRPATEANRR